MTLTGEAYEIAICGRCANYYVNFDTSGYESPEDYPLDIGGWVTVDLYSYDSGGYFRCYGCSEDCIGEYTATVEVIA